MLPYLEICTGRCYFCSYFRHYIISINIIFFVGLSNTPTTGWFYISDFFVASSDAWYYILSSHEGLCDITQTAIPVFFFIRCHASVVCCSTNLTPTFALYFHWYSKYDLTNFFCLIRRYWNIRNSARKNAVPPSSEANIQRMTSWSRE